MSVLGNCLHSRHCQQSLKTRGISLPKNLVHLWQKSFYFQEKSIKICINPFVLQKSRMLFQISELPHDSKCVLGSRVSALQLVNFICARFISYIKTKLRAESLTLGKMDILFNSVYWGSIIVLRLGSFGIILDAEYGCCKKTSAVYGFCIAMRLRKIGI